MSSDAIGGMAQALRRLGGTVTGGIARLGYMARFLGAILWYRPTFRRLHLTVREIYFSGVLS
ncbi:MAG: ABC transporter permease, partial [Casimicrobiaceae bacterium]